jgi:hypothetical protein
MWGQRRKTITSFRRCDKLTPSPPTWGPQGAGPLGGARGSAPIQIFLKIPLQTASKRSFPQSAFTPGAIEPPRRGRTSPKWGPIWGSRDPEQKPSQARTIMISFERPSHGSGGKLRFRTPCVRPTLSRLISSFPGRGGSMAPGVSAFGGKEGCEGLYGGILRNIYNEGAALKLPPKGPAPWGPLVGHLCLNQPK